MYQCVSECFNNPRTVICPGVRVDVDRCYTASHPAIVVTDINADHLCHPIIEAFAPNLIRIRETNEHEGTLDALDELKLARASVRETLFPPVVCISTPSPYLYMYRSSTIAEWTITPMTSTGTTGWDRDRLGSNRSWTPSLP